MIKMAKKYLDSDGLLYFWQKITNKFVAKETGKGLSTNDYTTAEKTKLSGIDTGAEVNVIEDIKVNGTSQTVTSKAVDITVPTSLSDLDANAANLVHDASYVHTDNNYTTTEKTKLSGIEDGAEVNVIESVVVNGTTATISGKTASVTIQAGAIDSISVNGTAQTIDANKNVDITVPTAVSDLTNDSGFITGVTSSDITTALGYTPYSSANPNGYQTASEVDTAIDAKIGSTYKPKGSVAFASLPTPASTNEGFVYNVTDAFTTTADFVEGAGKNYPAGSNVVIINTTGTTYKFDVLGGFIDLSAYQLSADLVAITNAEIDVIVAS